jgi:nucleotide-binding universal stress UspA family protein
MALRSILVGLDGSQYSQAATELAIGWGRQFGARVAGIAVIDQPSITESSAKAIVAADDVYRSEMQDAREHIATFLSQFRQRCEAAGIDFTIVRETGPPIAEILLEVQRHDIILLGKETYFRFETQQREDDVANEIIQHSPRPVVVLPQQVEEKDAVVIAYDTSLQAAKALGAFLATGIGESRSLHLVSVSDREDRAQQMLQWAADYLELHTLAAQCHAVATDEPVGEVLLEKASQLDAGLLVMGVYGKPALHSFFFGSTTKFILEKTTLPVLVYH